MIKPNEFSTREEIAAYLKEHGPYRYRPEGCTDFVYIHTLDTDAGWALNDRDREALGRMGIQGQ